MGVEETDRIKGKPDRPVQAALHVAARALCKVIKVVTVYG
jgi:hypothetical protein